MGTCYQRLNFKRPPELKMKKKKISKSIKLLSIKKINKISRLQFNPRSSDRAVAVLVVNVAKEKVSEIFVSDNRKISKQEKNRTSEKERKSAGVAR